MQTNLPHSFSTQSKPLQSYLLRMWKEHADAPWRLQLKTVEGDESALFESISELVEHLIVQMER